jgi:RNA polymerase sigma-70 factor (ECF subfamily)
MATSADFEQFYTATVGRVLGQIFLAADRARSLRRQARAILNLGPPPAAPAVSVEALRTLPVRQREAIVMYYLADLPIQEIAQVLAVPSGTVKRLLARGRRALAAKLGESEEVLYPS